MDAPIRGFLLGHVGGGAPLTLDVRCHHGGNHVDSERKVGSALIQHAKPNFKVYILPLAVGGVAAVAGFGAVLATSKFLSGGLWVGGEIELSGSTIAFRPNAINRALHKADYRVEIPLVDMTDVRNEFGFVTGIISLLTDNGLLKIRVYGAKEFADAIRGRVAAVRTRHDF